MTKQSYNKFLLFIAFVLFLLILPGSGKAQLGLSAENTLLKEYIFPVSSYQKIGAPVSKSGAACDWYGSYGSATKPNCSSLPLYGTALPPGSDPIYKWTDNTSLNTTGTAEIQYEFTLESQDRYVFIANVSSDADNFYNMTREQVDYIFQQYLDGYAQYDTNSYNISGTGSLEILEYAEGTDIIPADSNQKYDLFRSMIFSVRVAKKETPEDIIKKGYMVIRNDGTAINQGEVVLDNLAAGEYYLYLNFVSDYYWDFSGTAYDAIPAYFQHFSNADLNGDKALDVNPIIHEVSIDKIRPADDAIGIRIYTNPENIDPATWYRENVVNAAGNVEQLKVDGYQAIRDQRTVYVNAANLDERLVCIGGSKDGQACNNDGDCGSGATCSTRRFFYTNIYVIAYNQNATPSTINIYNQMFDNWVFNRNVIKDDPINAETNKDKLRRDTIRKQDLAKMNRMIKSYYQANGKYPTLDAGTYSKGHTLSVWPSWQSTLANQLKGALPQDPVNKLTIENRGPYNCNDATTPAEKCIVRCDNNSLGCPDNNQCVNNSYCSICDVGFDKLTCWNETEALFNYYNSIHGSTCPSALAGSFNLGGTQCQNDGAFVYQYTSLEGGKSYLLNVRFEYSDTKTCAADQCVFNNRCYPAGSCLASCDANGENCGYCSDPNKDTQATCTSPDTWTSMDQYKNLSCSLGNWQASCGDGFNQSACGETCDYNVTRGPEVNSWCDAEYNPGMDRAWYNEANIKETCSQNCQSTVAGVDYMPQAYTYDLGDVDCGGYCGDYITQYQSGEQCDEGPNPADLKPKEQKGAAGVSQVSQYRCSGQTGGAPENKTAADCFSYTHWANPTWVSGNCTALPTDDPTAWLSKNSADNSLSSFGGFTATYVFNPEKEGTYNFKLKAANDGANLIDLTDDQIAYLISEQLNNNFDGVTSVVDLPIDSTGKITSDVPTNDPTKYDLIRSLSFAVYLDGTAPQNKIGYITVPGTKTSLGSREGNISLGNLGVGTHTVTLEFYGDYFWYLIPADLPAYLNNFINVLPDAPAGNTVGQHLDINPRVFDVSLYSPELSVGSCQTFGGYCGDGLVQMEFGEQCDIKNFKIPTPAETVNLVKNPSFEGLISPWIISGANAEVDDVNHYDKNYSLKLNLGTAQQVTLEQPVIMSDNISYIVSLRAKPVGGNINSIILQGGDNSASGGWDTANQQELLYQSVSADGWSYYQENFSANNYYKYRLIINVDSQGAIINLDDLLLQTFTQPPQYQCSNNQLTGKLCQSQGGYCGDGTIQTAWGETCDDRIGYTCANNTDCGKTGLCLSGICSSTICNKSCQGSACGDGVIQTPNGLGVNEVCDWLSDAYCTRDCLRVKMGGICSSTKPCDFNLSCSIRNFGDTIPKCLGARGSYGCNKNADCILGYYCDISTSKCEPEISTYLKYHPEPATTPGILLPSPPAPVNTRYDINNTTCPYLVLTSTQQGAELLIDRCTGIHWEAADNITQTNWTYYQAEFNACDITNSLRLPNIMELYSLVRQTNMGLFYSDKQALRLCALNCLYAPNEDDLCSDCPDDNYIYWSSTCTEGTANTQDSGGADNCTKALAVNFKYGSIEEYPTINDTATPNYDDAAKFKVHCIRDVTCGNGTIEPGETCEFVSGSSPKIEQVITKKCNEFGYDGGILHCDQETCNFKMDNCYLNSQINTTCEDVCRSKKDLACQSIGLDITAVDEAADGSLANDNSVLNTGANNVCEAKPGSCSYIFQNRNTKCTEAGQAKPFISEYSYCNCQE